MIAAAQARSGSSGNHQVDGPLLLQTDEDPPDLGQLRELQAVGCERQFRSFKPRHLGTLTTNVLFKVLEHICRLGTATPEEVERLADVIDTMRPSLSLSTWRSHVQSA